MLLKITSLIRVQRFLGAGEGQGQGSWFASKWGNLIPVLKKS